MVAIYFIYIVITIYNNNPNIDRVVASADNSETLIKGKNKKVNETDNDFVLNKAGSEAYLKIMLKANYNNTFK